MNTESLRKQKKVLLVGNGINKAQNISWGKMLTYIQTVLGKDETSKNDEPNMEKQSPTILLEAIRFKYNISENEIQKIVTNYVADKSHYVQKLWNLYDVILTTNFDDNLIITKKDEQSKTNKTKNILYCKKGFSYNSREKELFYIHGNYYNPETICLGFDKYTDNLKRIEDFSNNYINKKSKKTKNFSWVEYFLKDDITMNILGFALCRDEIDIWWLLTFRKKNISKIKNNVINYYDLDENVVENELKKELEQKYELLKTFDVNVIKISEVKEYGSDFYSLCMKRMKEEKV